MYILGLTTMGEAAASLLKDGELVAAAEEERFSRIKHHIGFPCHAVAYCLREAGITLAEVDHIGHYWKPWVLRRRVVHTLGTMFQHGDLFQTRIARGSDQFTGYYLPMFVMPSTIRKEFGGSDFKFHYLDHHVCHAASAFFASPFDSAAIFTVDGVGESTTVLYARGEGKRIKVLERIHLPHSLGQFYSAITNFLGFDMLQGDEYKVMGLAAFGEPEYAGFFQKSVVMPDGPGRFKLDISYIDHQMARNNLYTEKIQQVLGKSRLPQEEVLHRHENIAASAQKALEETALRLVRYLKEKTGERNLCLAGGVALNSVMNGRIVREAGFDNVFIQPAAHDGGCSLGAALYVYHNILKHPRKWVMEHAYWGPGFSSADCSAAMEGKPVTARKLTDAEMTVTVAKLLSEGSLIAWFQGRMEWGPRALGNRSFLADPRTANMQEVINRKIKLREPFRPFAPSMLEEDAAPIIGCSKPSPYMLLVFPVNHGWEKRIPAVVHVDGTARPQTISRRVNPRYWSLVNEFKSLTGIPAVLNTSFNIQEPIVCTPEDALKTFINSGVDYLVLEDYLVQRNP